MTTPVRHSSAPTSCAATVPPSSESASAKACASLACTWRASAAAPGDAAVLPGSAAAAAAEARHVHARLAHAFALADSLDGGTVAAHEVGALLWRTGVVTAAAQLAALRPLPSDSAKRVGFEQALRA